MKLTIRTRLAFTVTAASVALSALSIPHAGASGSTSLIQGSGSSWAANAVNQWVADVAVNGVQVVYTPDGDAQGRQDFATKTSDFSVTSIGFQGIDAVTGVADTSQGRNYSYLPIAAGGTAFPYQIKVGGRQVRNLRLSGETLTKIFTNKITNWNDPAITKDNNGTSLPSLPITPVVQAEGSGSTAQLTTYFAKQFPSLWRSFAGQPGMTEYYPRQGNQIAQTGSSGAMNYVSSSSANGSIGYVEYSYALAENYPVAKLLNAAGFYTLPTQYNVAVALQKAVINMDKNSPNYLLQNLDQVYVDTDPRTYPLSSYVYMIEPTGVYPKPETNITTSKRQAIANFEYYAICQGQREIGPIGYSPLPVNLVEASFGQIQKLKDADPGVSLQNLNILTCANPTFVLGHPSANYLAQIAPKPLACDAVGAGPCVASTAPTGGTGGSGGSSSAGTGTSAGGSGSGSGSSGTGTGSSGSTSQTGGATNAGIGDGTVQVLPVTLARPTTSLWSSALSWLAAVLLALVCVVPSAVALRRSRRKTP